MATVTTTTTTTEHVSNRGNLAPRAAVFYPSADANDGGGTLCITDGQPGDAALMASVLPFVIPEKTGPIVGQQPEAGYAFEAASVAAANTFYRWVLYTSPDGDVQVTAMTVPPGSLVGLEVHPDTAQLITVQEGNANVRIGNQEYHVGPGAWIVVPHKTIHRIDNTSATEPLRLIIMYTSTMHPPGLVEPCRDSLQLAETALAMYGVMGASPIGNALGAANAVWGASSGAHPRMIPRQSGAYPFAANGVPGGGNDGAGLPSGLYY